MDEQPVAVVIEDELDLRELTGIMLTQCGFDVVTADDGPSGIEAVREHDPVLTTLDVTMPGMDGYTVAERLREFSRTHILMITGQVDQDDVRRAFDAGADDWLPKPFSGRDLRSRAESALQRARAGD